ncbi:MAG: CHASE2 domain-containing protein [Phaeodactylibacter sp.]|uniref:CHASE2 domain-containing protein n=1 Tax=Phaeodactylibacter sp. TaxID=1940289 RepID=UPI0032EB89D3
MLNRIIQPHSIIITVLIFLFIWFLNLIRLNMHYIDPFNNGLKNYEITDIVYAYLRDSTRQQPISTQDMLLVHTGTPDRERIALLIDRLREAGAAAIGVDVLFEKPKTPYADSLLQAVIQRTPNLVLACEVDQINEQGTRFERWKGVDTLFANYSKLGYVNFPANRTRVIRFFSPREQVGQDTLPAFTTALLQTYAPKKAAALLDRKKTVERIYYTGPQYAFPRQEQDQLLDSLNMDEVRSVAEGKMVLLGYIPREGQGDLLKDRHYTPLNQSYTNKSIPDMYGLAIHANVLNMVLKEQYTREIPSWLNVLLLIIFCYLNVLLIHWVYDDFNEVFHGITRGLQLLEFILLFFLIALLFYLFRINLDFGAGILALLLAYDIIMIYENLVRKRLPWLDRIPETLPLRTAAPAPVSEEEE